MKRFFVSDVHLNEKEPTITVGFLHFLEQLPENCELYILGDLFDYWIGDDVESELAKKIGNQLYQLTSRNIHCYFIAGNRDFLIGKSFSDRYLVTLLPDRFKIDSDQLEPSILIEHGDLLCIDDVAYQKFRKKMHNPILQFIFKHLPKSYRIKIGEKLRKTSREANQLKRSEIMDVNQNEVVRVMDEANATLMIHGHTHRMDEHQFEHNGQSYKRVVLGAWHDGANYALQNELGEIELSYFNGSL